MKRMRNSVKAIIISVCVAIVAASAIVGVVLFNRNKGDKNPPVQPQGSYQLTPAQKELVESINAEQKLQAETSSKVLKEVDESMFVTETGASVDVETISAVYDDCFVVNDGDNINIYFYSEDEYGNKTSINLFSYMREENLIEQNYTSIKANQIHEDYVAYTYTYSDGTKAYQVLEVAYVPNLEEIAVVNRVVFENLSGTLYFDEKEVVEIDIIFKKSYYLIYHQYYEENSLCLNYSLYTTNFVNENTCKIFNSLEIKDFDISEYSSILYLSDNTYYFIVFGADISFYKFDGEANCSYKFYSFKNGIFIQIEKKLSSLNERKDTSIFVDIGTNGYYADYSYCIYKFKSNSVESIKISDGYSKFIINSNETSEYFVYSEVKSEDYVITDERKMIYLDNNLDVIINYDIVKNTSYILYSKDHYILTTNGIISTKNSSEGQFILNFADENLQLRSKSFLSDYFYVYSSSNKKYKIYSITGEDVFKISFDEVVDIGNGKYFAYITLPFLKHTQVYFADASTGSFTNLNVVQDCDINDKLNKNYSSYIENNGDNLYTLVNVVTGEKYENIKSYTELNSDSSNYILNLVFSDNSSKILNYSNKNSIFSDIECSQPVVDYYAQNNIVADNYGDESLTSIPGDNINIKLDSTKTTITITFKNGKAPDGDFKIYFTAFGGNKCLTILDLRVENETLTCDGVDGDYNNSTVSHYVSSASACIYVYVYKQGGGSFSTLERENYKDNDVDNACDDLDDLYFSVIRMKITDTDYVYKDAVDGFYNNLLAEVEAGNYDNFSELFGDYTTIDLDLDLLEDFFKDFSLSSFSELEEQEEIITSFMTPSNFNEDAFNGTVTGGKSLSYKDGSNQVIGRTHFLEDPMDSTTFTDLKNNKCSSSYTSNTEYLYNDGNLNGTYYVYAIYEPINYIINYEIPKPHPDVALDAIVDNCQDSLWDKSGTSTTVRKGSRTVSFLYDPWLYDPLIPNYDFLGWSVTSDAIPGDGDDSTVEIDDTDQVAYGISYIEVTQLMTTNNATATLKAVFAPKMFTVNLEYSSVSSSNYYGLIKANITMTEKEGGGYTYTEDIHKTGRSYSIGTMTVGKDNDKTIYKLTYASNSYPLFNSAGSYIEYSGQTHPAENTGYYIILNDELVNATNESLEYVPHTGQKFTDQSINTFDSKKFEFTYAPNIALTSIFATSTNSYNKNFVYLLNTPNVSVIGSPYRITGWALKIKTGTGDTYQCINVRTGDTRFSNLQAYCLNYDSTYNVTQITAYALFETRPYNVSGGKEDTYGSASFDSAYYSKDEDHEDGLSNMSNATLENASTIVSVYKYSNSKANYMDDVDIKCELNFELDYTYYIFDKIELSNFGVRTYNTVSQEYEYTRVTVYITYDEISKTWKITHSGLTNKENPADDPKYPVKNIGGNRWYIGSIKSGSGDNQFNVINLRNMSETVADFSVECVGITAAYKDGSGTYYIGYQEGTTLTTDSITAISGVVGFTIKHFAKSNYTYEDKIEISTNSTGFGEITSLLSLPVYTATSGDHYYAWINNTAYKISKSATSGYFYVSGTQLLPVGSYPGTFKKSWNNLVYYEIIRSGSEVSKATVYYSSSFTWNKGVRKAVLTTSGSNYKFTINYINSSGNPATTTYTTSKSNVTKTGLYFLSATSPFSYSWSTYADRDEYGLENYYELFTSLYEGGRNRYAYINVETGSVYYYVDSDESTTEHVTVDTNIKYGSNMESVNANFNNTSIIAVRPEQYQIYVSTNPTTLEQNAEHKVYDLASYLASIQFVVGNSLFTFDLTRRDENGDLLTAGVTYTYDDMVFRAEGIDYSGTFSDTIENTISYLGEKYIIHQYYYFTLNYPGKDKTTRNYVLYLARHETTRETYYFMYSDIYSVTSKGGRSTTTNNIDTIIFNFAKFDTNVSLTINTPKNEAGIEDKYNATDKPVLFRYSYNDVAYDNDELPWVSDAPGYERPDPLIKAFSDTSNGEENMYFDSLRDNVDALLRISPCDTLLLEIQPTDGYLIDSIEVKVGGSRLFKFEFSHMSISQVTKDGKLYYSYSYSDGEFRTNISYNSASGTSNNALNNYISGNYHSGLFFSSAKNLPWNAKSYNSGIYFNPIWLMISGVYEDVTIDVTTNSYVEFYFYDLEGSGETLGYTEDVETGAQLQKLSKLTMLAMPEGESEWIKLGTIKTDDGLSIDNVYDADTILVSSDRRGYGVAFSGKAFLFSHGVKFYASGEDYSAYFTSGSMYVDSEVSAFSKLDYKTSAGNAMNGDDYIGKHADGTSLYSTATGDSSLDFVNKSITSADYATYIYIRNISQFHMVDKESVKEFNYDENTFKNIQQRTSADSIKLEYSNKFFMRMVIKPNTTTVTTNSYLYSSAYDNTYNGTYKYGYLATSDATTTNYQFATTKQASYDTIAWINEAGAVSGYQLDYAGNLTDSIKYNKNNTWFNDTIVTNIAYSGYVQGSADKQTINWQDVSSTTLNNKAYNVYGYGITFDYFEVPGYYLQYIEIKTVDYGSVYLDIRALINDFNPTSSSGKFFASHQLYYYDETIKDSQKNNGFYYEITYYNGADGRFEIKLYNSTDSVEAGAQSIGLISNNFTVNFYSRPYTYLLTLNSGVEDGVTENVISTADTLQIANGTSTYNFSEADSINLRRQEIMYDSLLSIKSYLIMKGYTFIGWASETYKDGSNWEKRYSADSNTWNTSSKWASPVSLFKYDKREDLLSFRGTYKIDMLSYDFYVKSSTSTHMNNTGYFITDTGFNDAANENQENYNFWYSYAYLFTKNIGYFTALSGSVGTIDLHGIWKANVYSLQFDTNYKYMDAEKQLVNGSTEIVFDAPVNDGINAYNDAFVNGFYYDSYTTSYLAYQTNHSSWQNYYYCYIKFDSNNWYIDDVPLSSGVVDNIDDLFSHSSSASSLIDANNLFKMVVDRYGYSWLGWFSKRIGNAKTATEITSNTSHLVFNSEYGRNNHSLNKAPAFDQTLYNQLNADGSVTEVASEFVYHGQDKVDASLRGRIYVSHYYYKQTKLEEVEDDGIIGIIYNDVYTAYDYLNTYTATILYPNNIYARALIAYFDTSVSYDSYIVVGTGANASLSTVNRSLIYNNATVINNFRYIQLYAYWETNKYLVNIELNDNLTSGNYNYGSTSAMNADGTEAERFKTIEAYFDSAELSDVLNAMKLVRIGYDFLGWGYCYDYNDSAIGKNVAALINKSVDESQNVIMHATTQRTMWLSQDLVDYYEKLASDDPSTYQSSFYHTMLYTADTYTGAKATNDGVVNNSLYYEKFGDKETAHYAHIFAIWKPQTFSINLSLNLSNGFYCTQWLHEECEYDCQGYHPEPMKNGYEKDSHYVLGLYKDLVANAVPTEFIGFRSNYYMYDDNTYVDMVANVNYVVTFDGYMKDAYIEIAGENGQVNKYYLKHLFATSTGYYFKGWLYDCVTKSNMVNNTYASILTPNGLESFRSTYNPAEVGVSQLFDENVVFDITLFNRLNVSKYTYGESKQAFITPPSATLVESITGNVNAGQRQLSILNTATNSSNFGSIKLSDGINESAIVYCEEIVIEGAKNYYLSFKTKNGVKYYVLYYYMDGTNPTPITTDGTFLYYIDSDNVKYVIDFDSAGTAYCVNYNSTQNSKSDYSHRKVFDIRVAIFATYDKCSRSNINNEYNLVSIKNLEDKTYAFNYDLDIKTETPYTLQPTFYKTRQFTLYASWGLRSDYVLTVNNANSGDEGTQNAEKNHGLAGFYEITISDDEYESIPKTITQNVHTADQKEQNIIMSEYLFYSDLDLNLMPYYNGRYLSNIKFTFNGITESVTNLANDKNGMQSSFKCTTYVLEIEFDWNNNTYTIDINALRGIQFDNGSGTSQKYAYIFETGTTETAEGDINHNNLSKIANGEYGISQLSLLDRDSFYGSFLKIYEYGKYTNIMRNYGRTDTNELSMHFDNMMTSLTIDCKYSVQTYNLEFYSILDTEGYNLTQRGTTSEYWATSFASEEAFLNNKNMNNSDFAYKPYLSYENPGKTNVATISVDSASNVTSYNVPYGYFIYGLGYANNLDGYRPIDSAQNSKIDELKLYDRETAFFGFDYIYSYGYYKYGTTPEPLGDITRTPEDEVDFDTYSDQCSPVLGPTYKFSQASGIRLDGLSFYNFGGWYEYKYEGGVLFNSYDKEDEGTFIKRNITLYGYYYAVSTPTSIKFYTWDDASRSYIEYNANSNKYNLGGKFEDQPFTVSSGELVLKATQDNYVSGTGIAKIFTTLDYGYDREKFQELEYLKYEFDDTTGSQYYKTMQQVISQIKTFSWYYKDYYTALYYLDGETKHYIRYDRESTDAKRFYYLADEENLLSARTYGKVLTTDYVTFTMNGITLQLEENVYDVNPYDETIYNMDDSGDLYLYTNGKYYKIYDVYDEEAGVDKINEYKWNYYDKVYDAEGNEIENFKFIYTINKDSSATNAYNEIYDAEGNQITDWEYMLRYQEYYEKLKYLMYGDEEVDPDVLGVYDYQDAYKSKRNRIITYNIMLDTSVEGSWADKEIDYRTERNTLNITTIPGLTSVQVAYATLIDNYGKDLTVLDSIISCAKTIDEYTDTIQGYLDDLNSELGFSAGDSGYLTQSTSVPTFQDYRDYYECDDENLTEEERSVKTSKVSGLADNILNYHQNRYDEYTYVESYYNDVTDDGKEIIENKTDYINGGFESHWNTQKTSLTDAKTTAEGAKSTIDTNLSNAIKRRDSLVTLYDPSTSKTGSTEIPADYDTTTYPTNVGLIDIQKNYVTQKTNERNTLIRSFIDYYYDTCPNRMYVNVPNIKQPRYYIMYEGKEHYIMFRYPTYISDSGRSDYTIYTIDEDYESPVQELKNEKTGKPTLTASSTSSTHLSWFNAMPSELTVSVIEQTEWVGTKLEEVSTSILSAGNIRVVYDTYVKYDNEYYKLERGGVKKDTGGSEYITQTNGGYANLDKHTLRCTINGDTYYATAWTSVGTNDLKLYDVNGSIVSQIDGLDYEIYTPYNDNFNVNLSIPDTKYQVASITLQTQPSPNVGFWYDGSQYGFVAYIGVSDDDIKEIIKFDDINPMQSGPVYLKFKEFIEKQFTSSHDAYMQDLEENLSTFSVDSLKTSLLMAKEFNYDDDGNLKTIVVDMPVTIELHRYPYTINVPYAFNVVTSETSVDTDIDALPIYNPFIMKFTEDAIVTETGKNYLIYDTDGIIKYHFELKTDSTYMYTEETGDFLIGALLNEYQYKMLQQNISNIDSCLDMMIEYGIIESNAYGDILNDSSTQSLDLSWVEHEGEYFFISFYPKHNGSHIARVSDNFIHIVYDGSGNFTASINDFSYVLAEE